MLVDPDSNNWNDLKIQGEKVTIYDDKLLFRDTGVVFTLKGDILSMVTDYDFNKTDSPDTKPIVTFLDETSFDIYAKRKSSRDKNLTKNLCIKGAILASGLKNIFLSENPNELCARLKILLKKLGSK